MEMKDRVKQRMEELGFTQTALAEKVGVSVPSIQWLVSGKTKNPPRYISKLAKVLDVSYDWLLLGENPNVGQAYEQNTPQNLRKVPIIGWVHAGNPMEAIEHLDPDYYVEADFKARPNARALAVQGNSMNLIAPEDTIILFDPDDKITVPKRYYIIRVNEDEAVFRQFVMQGDTPLFAPCSTEDGHCVIEASAEIGIIGRVFLIPSRAL